MNDIFAWVLGIFIIVCLTAVVIKVASRVGLARQVFVAAVLFMSAAILLKIIFGLAGDENTYQSEALAILEQWQGGATYISGQPWTKLSLSYLLASFYYLTVPNMFLGVLLLTPIFCSLPVLIGQASYNFFGEPKVRQIAAWTAVFLPQTLIWSSLLLREGQSFFLLALGVYAASLMYRKRILESMALFAIALSFMMFVRIQLNFVLVSLFLVSALILAWDSKTNTKRWLAIFLSSVTIVGIFVATQVITKSIVGNVTTSDSIVVNSELREIGIRLNAGSGEALAYSIETDQQPGIASSVIYTAKNLLPSLIGPFPWQWKGYNWLVAGIDGLFMLFLIILSLAPLVLRRIKGAKVASILWIGALPLILANSLAMANYGIAIRVRANVALVLLPIAAYAAFQIYERVKSSSSSQNQGQSL